MANSRSQALIVSIPTFVSLSPTATSLSNRRRAPERKDLPLKDVAAAGGWKDVTTLLTCYQHADEATMLKGDGVAD